MLVSSLCRLLLLLFVLSPARAFPQHAIGGVRLLVQTADHAPAPAEAALDSLDGSVSRRVRTGADGRAEFTQLPFGRYRLTVEAQGLETHQREFSIATELPQTVAVTLRVTAAPTIVEVREQVTALPSGPHVIGRAELATATSTPGRAIADLVRTQPGWLLEAHGVLHPRGSEYDTQIVVDGFPLTDNRSIAFAPAFVPHDFESLAMLTGGYPAEYGRKLGGVIEATTGGAPAAGFSGEASAGVGSEDFRTADLKLAYARARWSARLNTTASRTDRFLDPPDFANLHNEGGHGALALMGDAHFSRRDQFRLLVRRAHTRFQVPNEAVQQAAGQRQIREGNEWLGQLSWQRTLSETAALTTRYSARKVGSTLSSNPLSFPIIAEQDRGFAEHYFSAGVTTAWRAHEVKFGFDHVATSARERFGYQVVAPEYFDDDIPSSFAFAERRGGRESAVFIQDRVRVRDVVVSAGIRYDAYSLVEKGGAFSPRLAVGWNLPRFGMAARVSYDRIFQTPAIENLLLASSPVVQALTSETAGLPLAPSRGNFWEAGFTKHLPHSGRVDAAFFARRLRNFADDDVFLNTGISFPVAFDRAEIHGFEARLELPRMGRAAASVSYSNLVGTGYLPLTGGLFLEDEARELLESRASFRISQDQRTTVAGLFSYRLRPELWLAVRPLFGSGLPVELGESDGVAGAVDPRILRRVDLAEGRLRPNWQVDLLGNWEYWRRDRRSAGLQLQCENLTGRLNVVNFAGLLSGTAVGSGRTVRMRASVRF